MKIDIYAIPGWGFCSAIFNELRCVDLNWIGLDYSKHSKLSLELIAEKLAGRLPDNAILLGWSFGGLIAIQLAALFPEKVKKLILLSSQPRLLADQDWLGIEVNAAQIFLKVFLKHPDQQMRQFIRLVSYPARTSVLRHALARYLLPTTLLLAPLLTLLFEADLRLVFQALSIEVLCFIDEHDAVITQNEEQIKRLKSDVKIVKLNKTGHAGFLVEPECYIHIIKAFSQHERIHCK